MSACISRHGEYGEHETDVDYICRLCGVFDEDGALAELRQLRMGRLTDLRPVPAAGEAATEDVVERACGVMWAATTPDGLRAATRPDLVVMAEALEDAGLLAGGVPGCSESETEDAGGSDD